MQRISRICSLYGLKNGEISLFASKSVKMRCSCVKMEALPVSVTDYGPVQIWTLFKQATVRRIMVIAQVLAVTFLVTASSLSVGEPHPRQTTIVPGYLPEVQDPALPWSVEQRRFADLLADVFGLPYTLAMDFSDWILEASIQQQVSPKLMAALVAAESSFGLDAVSLAGAVGPAQIKPHYWREYCTVEDLLDARSNIECSAAVLRHLIDRTGQEEDALRAYNVGLSSVLYGGLLLDRSDIYLSRVYDFERRIAEASSP